jgi:hypothetical protein
MTIAIRPRKRPALRFAAATATGVAAVLCLAGVAGANTLTNSSLIDLGQYPVPSSPPVSYAGQGSSLPTTDGALGQATEIMVGSGSVGQALTIPNGTTQWGTQLVTAPATGAASQTWHFQLIGTIGVTIPDPGDDGVNFSGPVYDQANVYKIINYNPNGTHTCLDGYGMNPTAGSIVDSYGCDPNQFNQTNQLWVEATRDYSDPLVWPSGSQASASNQLFSEYLQQVDWQDSVIENVATLQANDWVTNTAPVLAADTADILGESSPVTLDNQVFPARPSDATWYLDDIAPAAPAPSTPNPCPGMFICLV